MVQQKTNRGFTIIELMVVMSIMALMSVLGISALMSANNDAVISKGVENILSQAREAQNKSFSVAEAPNLPGVFPVGWGIKIDTNNLTTVENSIIPFYIKSRVSPDKNFDLVNLTTQSDFQEAGFTKPVVTFDDGSLFPTDASLYLIYSSPFGKFFATTDNIASVCRDHVCKTESDRPYNLYVDNLYNINKDISITFSFRNSVKVIKVLKNGDAFISS